MKQLLFFAVAEDLVPVFRAVEAAGDLRYATTGVFEAHEPQTFSKGAALPGLGRASASSSIAGASYVVVPAGAPVAVRKVDTDQGVRFAVDQLDNPDSVSLTPAGLWQGDVVLHGRVATASEAPGSEALMKQFASALKREFTKVKAYWVGPTAMSLLDAGRRLTISADSPSIFDLVK
jgi:hypothetical protein